MLNKNFKFFKKERLSNLPKTSGVYAFKDKKEIIYIGKAGNLRERVKSHFQQTSFRDSLFIEKVEEIGHIKTDSEIIALILESQLIKKYQPKFNILWRDDKNYFFVAITKEEFPRIFISHQIKPLKEKNLEIEYIGPFVDGKALKQTLKVLRKIFPFRTCKKIPKRPCLWFHLERCPAPCHISSELSKEEIKKESQKNVKALLGILRGEKKEVLRYLKREMKKAAKEEEFELAGKIRDQILSIEKVLTNAKVFSLLSLSETSYPLTEQRLRKVLRLKEKIFRMEGYDISDLQGLEATGSMVVFFNGMPQKESYRRFKIRFLKKPNDVGMIKEVLRRRFKHLEWSLPQVILIDGGISQLNGAKKVKNESENPEIRKIKMIALAKKNNELFIEGMRKSVFLKDLPSEVANLILRLRDEAHRFAKRYHLKLREKEIFNV